MDKKKVYKIIPVEFVNLEDGAYILKSPDGEQYKVTGGNIPTKKGNLIRLDKKTFLRLMNDIVLDDELEEIVIVNENDETHIKPNSYSNLYPIKERSTAVWPMESTRILLDMYRELRPLVFKAEIKTMKQMWEIITEKLRENGFDYDLQQVESKWKSLVRSYRVGLIIGVKRKSHYLAAPFEKEIGDILKMMNKIPCDKEFDTTDVVSNSPKRFKLEPKEVKPDSYQSELCNEEIISKQIFKLNTDEINNNLSQIVRAIEAGTSKREREEQKKQEQRERLIKAIERGNELLSQLLQKD